MRPCVSHLTLYVYQISRFRVDSEKIGYDSNTYRQLSNPVMVPLLSVEVLNPKNTNIFVESRIFCTCVASLLLSGELSVYFR